MAKNEKEKIYSNSCDKVLFEQSDVFVHTANDCNSYDKIIGGKLSIIEKNAKSQVVWTPLSDMRLEVEYDATEYGMVTTQKTDNENREVSTNPSAVASITFDVNSISSMRRSVPKLPWSYLIFTLKDSTVHPALHFHNGGINELISSLQRFFWLTRSPSNPRLYIVEESSQFERGSNHIDLFADDPSESVASYFNSSYIEALSGFSKVTQFVFGQNKLQERRPKRLKAEPKQNSIDHEEYEILQGEPDLFKSLLLVERGEMVEAEDFVKAMDEHGRINQPDVLKEKIFKGGVHENIKAEVWKFLLGYYDYNSTYQERESRVSEKRDDYIRMKNQWASMSSEQESRFTDFFQRKHQIKKDIVRTDRELSFYSGENNENVKILFNVLMTYCMYNFDLGYVQGMSDLLSPILQLVQNEVEAFWLFVGLMQTEAKNFDITQQPTKMQFENLTNLLKYMYPGFYDFLKHHESDNLYFCFRWILISFKRDFQNNDLMTLWEAMMCQCVTPYFKTFLCMAILEKEKDEMMHKCTTFNDILKHINDMAYKIDVNHTLRRAESICRQLKEVADLPDGVKSLLYYPSIIQSQSSENGCQANTTDCSQPSNNDDAVINLQTDTHSVF